MVRFALLATALLAWWSPLRAQPGPLQHIQVGDLDRTYLLERFHADDARSRLPIVIFLHGLGTLVTEGVPPRYDIPFGTEPSMEPALLVRPQGVDRRWDSKPGAFKTWTRLAGTNGEPVDDIGFLRALVDRLVADENGDPERVYVAGVSAGGYLVARVSVQKNLIVGKQFNPSSTTSWHPS